MKNKTIIIICILSLTLITALIIIFINQTQKTKKMQTLMKELHLQTKNADCLDGKGADYYFEKSEFKNLDKINDLKLTNNNLIAKFYQECEEFGYEIKKNTKFEKVNAEEFSKFLKKTNILCDDCLFLKRIGWPFFGEIIKYSNNKQICETGLENEKNCLEFKNLK